MSTSDFEQKPGGSRRIPASADEALHQGDLSSEESGVASSNANTTLNSLQANVGNAIVQDALMGDVLGGFGLPIAADLGGAIAGIAAPEANRSSNTAMLRLMRDSRIDWSSGSLNNLGREGGGKPMPQDQLQRFNEAFGHDFSHVRLHTDSKAAQASEALYAHAFALGADIYFGPGEYNPGSAATDRLLAHELTHVLQHDEGRLPQKTGDSGVSNPSDPAEQEAYGNEDRILGKLRTVDTSITEAQSESPTTGSQSSSVEAVVGSPVSAESQANSPAIETEAGFESMGSEASGPTFGPAIEAARAASPSTIAMREGGGLKKWLWEKIKGLLFGEGEAATAFAELAATAKQAKESADSELSTEQQRAKQFQEQFGDNEQVRALLHGTSEAQSADENIAILAANFAQHPFQYTMGGASFEAVLAGTGDCHSLAAAFKRIAEEALGIQGIEIVGYPAPFFAPPAPTLDSGRVGNGDGGSFWFFQNHYWVDYGGTAIDLLFPGIVPDESNWVKVIDGGRLLKDGQETEKDFYRLEDGRIVWAESSDDPLSDSKYHLGNGPRGHQLPRNRKGPEELAQPVLRKAASPDSGMAPGQNVLNLIEKSSGAPIPAAVAARMSSALGYDVSGARVHVDSAAAEAAGQLNALAFALGADIYFAEGRFAPGSTQGDELIAHELAHVVQHTEGRLPSTTAAGVQTSTAGDSAEIDADRMAHAAMDHLSSESSAVESTLDASVDAVAVDSSAVDTTGVASSPMTESAAPAIDSAPLSFDAAPAMREGAGDAVGMLPEKIRMTLAGMGLEVQTPSNAEVNTTVALNLDNELFTGLLLKTARVSFDEAYEFKGGAIVADVGLGQFISISETSLNVSSSGSVAASIRGAALNLNSVMATEINLTVGSDGIHGDATVGFDEITLQDGFVLNEGEVRVVAHPDGSVSGEGRLLGEIAGIGVFLLEAKLENDVVTGNCTIELETMNLGTWGKLERGVFEGNYTTEGTEVTGNVSMSIKDWATADINLTYKHPKDSGGTANNASAQGGGEGSAEAAAANAQSSETSGGAPGSNDVAPPVSQETSQTSGTGSNQQSAGGAGDQQGGGTTIALPGPGIWNGNVKLTQNADLVLGELTVSGGSLDFAIENNILSQVAFNANLAVPHFTGNAQGTYNITNDKLNGTGTMTLVEPITLESGVVITACQGEAILVDNEITQVSGSFEAEVPYKGEQTFRVNGNDLVYNVKEKKFSGTMLVTTMRELAYGKEDGIRAVIAEGASAEGVVEENNLKRITGELEYKVSDSYGDLGSGTLTMELSEAGPTATGTFKLDTQFGIPSREAGPAFIEPGAQLTLNMVEGNLTTGEIKNVTFRVNNPAGEGMGRILGMAEGTYDFQTSEVTVMVMAGVVEDWPFVADWGEIVFTSGGSVTVSIEKNVLDIFEVHVPFNANFNVGPGIKITGNVDGSYNSETQKYSGSVTSTLAENVDIVFPAGDKVTLIADATTATAEVSENALDTVSMGIKAQYFDKDGLYLLEGTISDAVYKVKESNLSFKGELALMDKVERQTDDGKWKLVVLPGRSINVEVADSQLTKIGGDVEFEIWDSVDKLLIGSINQAEVDTTTWQFSGELDLKTARDFEHPRAGGDLGTGPEWQFVVKEGSGVRGRIENNALANLGADLFFSVKRDGGDFAAGELSGDLDMQTDEFTGKGKISLTEDFVLEPSDKSGKLAGWALVINQGSGIDVDINKNDLVKTTINIEGRVDVDGTTYAIATLNGSYKMGDPDGYTGEVGIDVTNDIIWNQGERFQYMLAATSSFKASTQGSKVVAANGTFLLAASEGGVTKVIATLDADWTEAGGLNTSGEIDVEEQILIYSKDAWALYLDKDSGGTGTIVSDELTEIGGTIKLRLDQDGTPVVGGEFGANYAVAEGENASVDATGTITLLNPLDLGIRGDWGFELTEASAEGKITASDLDYIDGGVTVTVSYKGKEVGLAELQGRYTHGDKPDFSGTGSFTLYETMDTGVQYKDYKLFLDPGADITVEMADFGLKTLSAAIPTRINDGKDLLRVTLDGSYEHPDKQFDGKGDIELLRQVQVVEFGENYGIYLEKDTKASVEIAKNDFKELKGNLSATLHDDKGEFVKATAEGTYTKGDSGDNYSAKGAISVTREKRIDDGQGEFGFSILPCSGIQTEVADNELKYISGNATAGIYKGTEQVAQATANATYTHKPTPDLDANGGVSVLKDIDTGAKYKEFKLILAPGTGATVDVKSFDLQSMTSTINMRIDEGKNPLIKIELGGTYDHPGKNFSGSGKAELMRQVLVAKDVGPKAYSFYLEPVSGISATVVDNQLTQAEGTLGATVHDKKGEFLTVGAKGTYSKNDDEDKLTIEGAMMVTREIHIIDGPDGYSVHLIPGKSGGLVRIEDNELKELGGTISTRVDKDGKPFASIDLAGVYTPETGFSGKGSATLLKEIEVGAMGEYTLFIEPGTGADITVEANEPVHVGGTVKIRIDEGPKKFIKGEVTVDYDVKTNKVKKASGSAEVLIEKELGKLNDEKLFLCPGTGASVELNDGNLTKIGGTIILSLRDDSEYLNINLQGSFDAAGGTGFTGTGQAKVTKNKQLFSLDNYSFWLEAADNSGATAHIDKNVLTKVTGSVPFMVKDEQEEPLIRGQAEGTYDSKTGLFSGKGGIYLGRDVDFDMGGGALIKFKAGSGGGGEIVNSELRKLTGTLNCELHDSDGLLVTLSAAGEFDAVNKELVWVEGTATFARALEPLGPGIMILENLSGSARLEKGDLVWAKASGDIRVPPLNDSTGSFEVQWRNDGSRDYYSGQGKLNLNLIPDTGNGRSLNGEIDFKYNEDDTYNVKGTLGFQLNEKIGGEASIEMNGGKGQDFDPIIGAKIDYKDTLLPEKELFAMEMALLPAQMMVVGPGFTFSYGANAGMGLNLRPLEAEASIGFENWRPLSEGSTPTFTAGLGLSWGMDFSLFVSAYMSLGWVAVGAGVKGEAKLTIEVPVTASGELSGGPDGFDAALDFGVSISPTVTLSATPYVYLGVDGIAAYNADLATFEYVLDNLFSWEWNKRYHFGDTPETEDGAAAAEASSPAATTSDAVQTEAPPSQGESFGSAETEAGTPQMESGQEMSNNSGMAGAEGGGEMSDMEKKMALVEVIANGVGSLVELVTLIAGLIAAMVILGPIGLMLMFVYEICFNDLSWDKLKTNVENVIILFTNEEVLEYIEGLKPDWWKKLEDFIGGGEPDLMGAFFGADDKMREAVGNNEHLEADTKMRGEMVKTMMAGCCFDEDEDCILIVLRWSAGGGGGLTDVLNHAGGAQAVWEKLDGSQNDQLEALYDANGIHYSSGVGAYVASLW
jgi:hypothetical protein